MATRLILDSGGASRLAERSQKAASLLAELRDEGLWPPLVPVPVLVECLTGHAGRGVAINRLLRLCQIDERTTAMMARRAAALRFAARRGSAIDALVVAWAEPGGAVLTSDPDDLGALATHARGVTIVPV